MIVSIVFSTSLARSHQATGWNSKSQPLAGLPTKREMLRASSHLPICFDNGFIWVIFLSNHWNMSADQFREGMQNFVKEQFRIGPASGGRTSGYEPLPDTLNGPRDDMICQILKDCLARVGGPCDPSQLRCYEWKLLDRFVRPGKLRAFIEVRPEFIILQS